MEEQLISFEAAKLASEKGFKIKTELYYSKETKAYSLTYGDFAAVSQSILQKWLREIHKIHLAVVYSMGHNKYSVGGYDEFHWRELCKNNPKSDGRHPHPYKSKFLEHRWVHKTYENALEFGLIESLKLI